MHLFRKPRTRWLLIVGALIGVGLLGLAGQAEASDGLRGDRCVVAEEDYIAEDFYFFCRILEVRGTIVGDMLGVASEIHVYPTGSVSGDLWVAGGRLRVEGVVGDDIHFAGVTVLISEKARIGGDRTDLVTAALHAEIAQDARLPGDLLMYGYQAVIDGVVEGDVDFSGESLTIRGRIAGRVDATVGDWRRDADIPGLPVYNVSFRNPGLDVSEDAYIGGDLSYESAARRPIPPGVVQGRIAFEQVISQPDITNLDEADAAAELLQNYLGSVLRDVITLVFIGVIVLLLRADFIQVPAMYVRRRTIPTVGWGLVTFMLSFPFSAFLVLISLVILALLVVISLEELAVLAGVGLLVGNLALIGGFGFLLLFMGRVVVGFSIGYLLFRFALPRPQGSAFQRSIWPLAVGAVVYSLITNVPIPPLGLILELVTALAGVGAVVMFLRSRFYERRATAPVGPMVEGGAPPPPAPPPSPSEEHAGRPGMSNLPEGFSGFEEDW